MHKINPKDVRADFFIIFMRSRAATFVILFKELSPFFLHRIMLGFLCCCLYCPHDHHIKLVVSNVETSKYKYDTIQSRRKSKVDREVACCHLRKYENYRMRTKN